MKNREVRVLLAMAMTTALVVGSISGTTTFVRAEDQNAAVVKEVADINSSENEKKAETKGDAVKDETVYVKLDASGSTKQVTVSDQLKNVKNLSEIKDISELTDIENIKGEEEFFQKDGNLVWSGAGADICYQGTTNKKLPVGIKITYELDGKEISAEELVGKSGHLVIRYTYQNMTGEDGTEYTPFAMVTGLLLDSEKFTNVHVENGKIISDGEREIAVGIGIPGLKENLNVADLDIPESFEVEADVTDYEAVQGATIATNSLFGDISTDNFDSLDELEDSMGELESAANQLVDGAGALKDGIGTLLASSDTLISGIDQLASGGKQLAEGSNTLAGGASQLKQGSSALASGTEQLAVGSNTLNQGASALEAGAKSALAGTTQLYGGIAQLDQGVAEMQSQVQSGVEALASGSATLVEGATKVSAGAGQLSEGIGQASGAAAALSQGLTGVSQKAYQLADAVESIQLQSQGSVEVTVNETIAIDNSSAIAALQSIRSQTEDADIQAQIDGVIAQLSGQTASISKTETVPVTQEMAGGANTQAIAAGIREMAAGLGAGGQLGGGAAALTASLENTISPAAKSLYGALNEQILPGTQTLSAGIGQVATQLNAGTQQLKAGTGMLLGGEDGNGGVKALQSGMSALVAGAEDLHSGSAQLGGKMAEADAGAKTLAAGAAELAGGAASLATGAGTLSNGLDTLQSGSTALVDGVKQLDDGAAELNDGMIKFNKDGIQKLATAFDGDISALLDKANDMLDASRSYNNFSGIAEGMDGEVKFIFLTDK
ncbi:hypothetical protein ABXS75_04200 [Roseburia hominis]